MSANWWTFFQSLGFFVGVLLALCWLLEKSGKRTSCNHNWHSPAFRLRVCVRCKRREYLMREWEFDGYEKNE